MSLIQTTHFIEVHKSAVAQLYAVSVSRRAYLVHVGMSHFGARKVQPQDHGKFKSDPSEGK